MLDDLGNLERTHSCGAIRVSDVGKTVVLMGWVARRRDFGPLTFVDLRDRDGISQIVFNEETAAEAHSRAKELRSEFVIAVTGTVVLRDAAQRNTKLGTGDVEVQAKEIRILNDARTLPFSLEPTGKGDVLAGEDLRLKYRYLDLRRPRLQANLRLRHKVCQERRAYLSEQGFTEIETPILIKSTPEGARDYVVPARIQPGKFFALPQSPQLFKQLCMIAGLDKYFQIARCFRDEDLRADRQPEFTQLDVEMSFASPEQIYRLAEGWIVRLFRLIGVELQTPFLRLSYAEAMERFGSDKPDLRFGMELRDVSQAVPETDFPPFQSALATGGQIKALAVKGGAALSRKSLDELHEFVKRYGAKTLAWIKLGDEVTSPLIKAVGEAGVMRIAEVARAEKGDAVLIVSGASATVAASLGALRNEVARREKLIPANVYCPLWVIDFPMFEYHEEDGRYYAMHHAFTAPVDDDLPVFQRAVEEGETHLLGALRAKAYDTVVNGVEIAGGSIRIHRKDIQQLVFKAMGITPEKARERFGFFLDALEFGTPPHGGIASGIERTMMVLAGTENIRDVMAFPKTASASDLMIDAPDRVEESQLKELHIRIEG